MVSKTSLLESVKAFDWKAVDKALAERPDLLSHRERRGKNWLHVLCSTKVEGRKPVASIRTADVLLARGIDIGEHAFTEGRWKATPVWWCIAHGRNLALAEHLLRLGADPHYGAPVDGGPEPGDTPFVGAITWSRLRGAEALARLGADVNATDSKGLTAFHLMLKKGSDYRHFAILAKYGARVDIPGPDGVTAAEVMARKKDVRFRKLAAALGRGALVRAA